jgi:hypothetical protein
MPITLSNAIYRVRSLVNEPAYPTFPGSTVGNPSARLYTDTEITEWVNDGLRDISRRGENLRTYDTTITIPAYGENPAAPIPIFALNLGGISSSSDILRINRVEYQVGGDSSRVYRLEAATQNYMDNIWNVDQLSTMSYPSYWCTRGYPGGTGRNAYVIQLYPQAAQAGQLNIFYYRLPIRTDPVVTPANYTVTLDLLEGWDDVLIEYAQMKALIKARDPGWKDSQQRYADMITNIIDMASRDTDQPQYFAYDNMLTPWGDSMGGAW